MCSWTPGCGGALGRACPPVMGMQDASGLLCRVWGSLESFPRAWPGALVVFKARCRGGSPLRCGSQRAGCGWSPALLRGTGPYPDGACWPGVCGESVWAAAHHVGFPLTPLPGGTGPDGSGFSLRKLPRVQLVWHVCGGRRAAVFIQPLTVLFYPYFSSFHLLKPTSEFTLVLDPAEVVGFPRRPHHCPTPGQGLVQQPVEAAGAPVVLGEAR